MLFSTPKIELTGELEKIDQITNQLCEYAQDYNSRCVIILDPFISPFKDEIFQYFFDKDRITQVKISHSAVRAWQRPLLIALNLNNNFERNVLRYTIDKSLIELSPKILGKGGKRHYSGWIFTHATTQQIADDFNMLSIQKVGHGKLLLRFYDPAVFPQLLFILEPRQQIKLCGRIKRWALLDGNGDLFCHHNTADPCPVYVGTLGITQQLEDQLYCIGINNQVIKAYRKDHPTNKVNECEMLNHLMPCLLRLISQGFKDNELLVEWAKIAIDYGANFDLHLQIQEKLKTMKTRYDFPALLNLIKQTDWSF
jgi:hypothetical protein